MIRVPAEAERNTKSVVERNSKKVNKKICPRCGLELPEEAHFCPKCMYRYLQTESVQSEPKKKKHYTVIVCGVVITVFLMLAGGLLLFQEIEKQAEQEDIKHQAQLKQIFRTGEELPYHDEIVYDLRDCMTDWETVRQKLGEETEEASQEGEYTVHTYENAEITVNSEGIVQDIYINYKEDTDKVKYGLYGFCGTSEREKIKADLGTPDQNYGENEYFYRFEGIEGAPTLCFSFADDGSVEEIEYYR